MKLLQLVSLFILIVALAGCETYNNGQHTRSGVAIGSVIGGVTGAVIGHQSGHSGEGAALGAVLGAAVGGTSGSSKDIAADRAREEQRQKLIERNAIIEANQAKEREQTIALGYQVTDQEVLEAEQRAAAAANELKRIEKQRAEAMERKRRIDAAQQKEAEALEAAASLRTYD
jgi:hypothetical protein